MPDPAPPPPPAGKPGLDFRDNLVKTWVSPALLRELASLPPSGTVHVIITVNAAFPGGSRAARSLLAQNYRFNHPPSPGERPINLPDPTLAIDAAAQSRWQAPRFDPADHVNLKKSSFTDAYLFARIRVATIEALLADCAGPQPHPIHKIWRDDDTQPFVFQSVRTVKGDAARVAFGMEGAGIVWAVADTGIDGNHPHFALYGNLDLSRDGIRHYDFTDEDGDDEAQSERSALTDEAGHGTHVAGIIAGRTVTAARARDLGRPSLGRVDAITIDRPIRTSVYASDMDIAGEVPDEISGIAARCKLVSLKVMNGSAGRSSDLIAALGYIQQVNSAGHDLKIHGVNLSLGYPFDPTWFAPGASPLCIEVDRLVRAGVVVVVAAGNSGYGPIMSSAGATDFAALSATIADPGNARLAITVGATHRDEPHTFGVSYFSAKGPTADGRLKPDLVAPGERIVSCKAGPANAAAAADGPVAAAFKQDSGTSMAAPHVSAIAAGLLSVRREYIGRPEEVKGILMRAATDLGRLPEYQGAGLVDIMRALQSV